MIRWVLIVLALGAGTSACEGQRRVDLVAHYSHWQPAAVRVPRGVPVTFVVRNADPIKHELVVGDQALQDRHERGTEPSHGTRPTEVDLPAGATVSTTIVFAEPGRLFFACHLPGHYAYGMHGVIEVR